MVGETPLFLFKPLAYKEFSFIKKLSADDLLIPLEVILFYPNSFSPSSDGFYFDKILAIFTFS